MSDIPPEVWCSHHQGWRFSGVRQYHPGRYRAARHLPGVSDLENGGRQMKPSEYLLRAILENPADDLARLAYADALEEEGDTTGQAELIRAGDGYSADMFHKYAGPLAAAFGAHPQAFAVHPRVDLLYGKNRSKLCASLHINHGFVIKVTTDLRWWQKQGERLCLLHPVEKAEGLVAPYDRYDWCHPRPRASDAWHWRREDIVRDVRLGEFLREFLCVRLTQRFYVTADEARADFNAACLEWAKPEWLRPKKSSNTALSGRGGYVTAGGVSYSIKSWSLDRGPVLLDPRRIVRGKGV